MRHLHLRASAHPPEGLYIRRLFNAGYIDMVCSRMYLALKKGCDRKKEKAVGILVYLQNNPGSFSAAS
ncbi:hypothetical protein D7V82_14010 [bacterium 1xD8-6]|nr:hypothetical protein D7V72_15515 [bacterium D16-36]RKI66847.1 hypothetical protein D7V82_14010 [bacterium 1xD8-6]